ncbi:MAG: ABC transporter permease [Caldilineaceae bacterium]|nr:ABC transporter permease [Caldilineaceae bacterium]
MQSTDALKAEPLDSQRWYRRLLAVPELGAATAVVLAFLFFTLLNRQMADPGTFIRILTQTAYMGFAAYGMCYLMIAGELDLSTGAMAGLAAAVTAILVVDVGWTEWQAMIAALTVAVAAGLVTSTIVLKIRMPSFFATLGMSFVITGCTVVLLQGRWVYVSGKIPILAALGTPSTFFGVPWNFVLYLGLVLVGDFLMRRSRLGPILSATGGNRRAAEVSGINTALVKTLCFVLISICSAFAGMLVMNVGVAADPEIGNGWPLWIIAIAIIGGCSFSGGVGSILGGMLGTILIMIIRIGLAAANVQTNAQGVVVGVILVAAAILDVLRRRAKQY